MVNTEGDFWHWHHNVSEAHYHIQLTVKYRKVILNPKVRKTILITMKSLKQRYTIEISKIGFDKNHLHILCRFLPKYSGGQVIKVIKSITAKQIFKQHPEVKKELWGGEFWTDGYYFATVSGRGNQRTIENYIKNQGREEDIKQLELFDV